MTWLLWAGFLCLIGLLLALDLGVLNRKPHVISAGEALGWTAFWILLALLFNGLVYVMYEHHWLGLGQELGRSLSGKQAALSFLTAYLVEKSLSLDNIFVIAMIFSHFSVPSQYQHRVLFWGILGALVLRGTMILGGLAIIDLFTWTIYVFGGLLLVTAIRMLVSGGEDHVDPGRSPFVRWIRKVYPITEGFRGQRFFVHEQGRRAATPLLLALGLIESTDVLFAVDSIPAVFAVTRDPFLVFSSNVFAILGLRSLYFALAAVLHRFRYMKVSLVFLLAFIGVKMMLSHHYPIPVSVSLGTICGILGLGVAASLWLGRQAKPRKAEVPSKG